MKMQIRLLFIATAVVLALGWFGLRADNADLERRLQAAQELDP